MKVTAQSRILAPEDVGPYRLIWQELCRSEQVRELETERLSWIPGGASKSQASSQEGDVRLQAEVREGWEDAALLAGMSEEAGALSGGRPGLSARALGRDPPRQPLNFGLPPRNVGENEVFEPPSLRGFVGAALGSSTTDGTHGGP